MLNKSLQEYFADAKKIVKEQQERGGPEFPTSITFIDQLTNGMHRGEIWIVSGKTGSGKTSLALQMARSFADNPNNTILYLSLEMKGWELVLRMYCEMNNVSFSDIMNGKVIIDEDMANFFNNYISKIDFEIVEGGYMFKEVEQVINEYYKTKHPDIIFLDFIQMIEWKNFNDERIALMEYIRKIKELANKTGIGFVIVSQIRRQPSGSDYAKAPDLSDLKGSGSLEQMADKVLFIYKTVTEEKFTHQEYYQHYINLAKNRQGRTMQKQVIFEGEYYKFTDSEFLTKDAKNIFEAKEI